MLNSIKTKLLLLISVALGVTVLAVVGFTLIEVRSVAGGIAKIIDQSQADLYAIKLQAVVDSLTQEQQALVTAMQESGLAGTSAAAENEKAAQDSALERLRSRYFPRAVNAPAQIHPFILDRTGSVLLHPRLKTGDRSLAPLLQSLQRGGGELTCDVDGQPTWVMVVRFAPWDWTVAYAVPAAAKYAMGQETNTLLYNLLRDLALILAVLVVIVIAAQHLLVTRLVTNPVRDGVARLTRVAAQGDIAVDVPAALQRRRDEIGDLARAVQGIIASQREQVKLTTDMARGHWNLELTPRSAQDRLSESLAGMIAQVNTALAQVQEAGEKVSAGASQIAGASRTLSQGATEQAASLEEVTSALTEMGGQTRQNAENATSANALAATVRGAAETGDRRMREMVDAMAGIDTSSHQIAKIIKVIDDIAFQTNLLALNAAVEAARAGRHGRGFAVVADEVRHLAVRSAKAAEETAELIEGARQKVTTGSAVAGQTAKALLEIVAGIVKVSGLVDEIAAASNEQAQGIAQVNQGLAQIGNVTQQNTANAEETAAAATELSGQAQALRQLLARFTLRTDAAAAAGRPRPVAPPPAGNAAAAHPAPAASLDDHEFGRY